MSDELHFNRKMAFDDWAKQSEVTADEAKAVKERVKPIEHLSTGDRYQETSLDRELEIVREQNYFGHDIGVGRSEAERIAVMTARQMQEMQAQYVKQDERRDKQDSHLTNITSQITTLTSMLARNFPHGPISDYMKTQDVANALGCGQANVLKMLKEGTIPSHLLIPGTDKKSRERRFKRTETEEWLSKYLKGKKPSQPRSKKPRRTSPNGRQSGK